MHTHLPALHASHMGKASMHPLNNLHTALSQSPRPWDSTKHAVCDDTRMEAKHQTGVPSSPPLLHAHETRHTSLHKSVKSQEHASEFGLLSHAFRALVRQCELMCAAAHTTVAGDGGPHSPPFTAVGRTVLDPQYAALMHPVCKNTMFPHSTTTDIRTHSLTHSLTAWFN
jgi:hypothetical protein